MEKKRLSSAQAITNKRELTKSELSQQRSELKLAVQKLLTYYGAERMLIDLNALEPGERLRIVTGLMPFVLPRIQHNYNENDNQITVNYMNVSKQFPDED